MKVALKFKSGKSVEFTESEMTELKQWMKSMAVRSLYTTKVYYDPNFDDSYQPQVAPGVLIDLSESVNPTAINKRK